MITRSKLSKYVRDRNTTLNKNELTIFIDALYQVIYEEELDNGSYSSIKDADIGGLIDSSDRGSIIREYGYKWLGLDDSDYDDDMSEEDI